jgi:multiple sugar transport system ATP-binding protein
MVGIRPEDLEDAEFASSESDARTITTTCTLREALGSEVLLHFAVGDENLVARVHPETGVREGGQVRLVANTRRLHFVDPRTERTINTA